MSWFFCFLFLDVSSFVRDEIRSITKKKKKSESNIFFFLIAPPKRIPLTSVLFSVCSMMTFIPRRVYLVLILRARLRPHVVSTIVVVIITIFPPSSCINNTLYNENNHTITIRVFFTRVYHTIRIESK